MNNFNNKNYYYYCLITFSLFTFHLQLLGQVPDFAHVPSLRPGDSANISHLINVGVRTHKKKIIAWFPKDSLSKKQMSNIVDTLNIGVAAAEKFIKAPLSWQVHLNTTPYTFYFRLDSFIPHGSGAGL